MEWAATGERVCGHGASGSVSVDAEGWEAGGDAPALTGIVDAAVSGTAEAVGLPAGAVALDDDPLEAGRLSEGVHAVVVDSTPATHLAFEGPATVEVGDERWIRFPERRPVAVGFSETAPPRPVVSVPPTPSGLATAVTAAGRTHATTGPERSHPGLRPPTPRVRFGDRTVPDDLETGPAGPTMTVPESVPAVLVAAPLAYYLGADLRIEQGPPAVRGDGLDHEFEPMPAFADGVADALRALVTRDGLVRSAPGEPGPLTDDADDISLAGAPPGRRLAAALSDPPATLPTWPLSAYVDDDVATGRYLPYLLDRLSLVHPAEASDLDPKALLERSLDEFYRGETPNVEAVDPTLADSRFHAWLADGTPVDAVTLLRPESPGVAVGDAMRIDVVCNEPEMATERSVADVYRRRLAGRDVDVRVHERLGTADLAAVFERPTDLVHFIGHCETDGMVCPDGTLAAADLEDCGAGSFFLNACGSYYEGYDLVRRGATVGAVTLTAVLDEQAVTLGTAFAELLAGGFAFDRALSLARGEIIVGRDYVVVGDGTHRLTTPTWTPGTLHVEAEADGYRVMYDATAPDAAGRRYPSPVDGETYLCGVPTEATMDADGVADLLGRVSAPVRYDGALHWSADLAGGFPAASEER